MSAWHLSLDCKIQYAFIYTFLDSEKKTSFNSSMFLIKLALCFENHLKVSSLGIRLIIYLHSFMILSQNFNPYVLSTLKG